MLTERVSTYRRNNLVARMDDCIAAATSRLLGGQTAAGYWEGELAASPFATALAMIALALLDRTIHSREITRAAQWLLDHQNSDGGWGDTDISPSNPGATLLSLAAFKIAGSGPRRYHEGVRQARQYLKYFSSASLEKHYGGDRTFADPIRAIGALAGFLDWREAGRLPFEVVLLPSALAKAASLPVVSFSLPILIAIGILQHHRNPSRNLLIRALRHLAISKGSELLRRLQPAHGGFLESPVCTSLVITGLVAGGFRDSIEMENSANFLLQGQRGDGSWPIVTNLSVWNTTLSLRTLAEAGFDRSDRRVDQAVRWLERQCRERRDVFTGGMAHGWTWTHLDGGLVDADDTANAILALADFAALPPAGGSTATWMMESVTWLKSLQNADGGWPTFSKGSGSLAFDRSSVDITSNVAEVFARVPGASGSNEVSRGLSYIYQAQGQDGSWDPLWFGNEFAGLRTNSFYGTYKALGFLSAAGRGDSARVDRGLAWIVKRQNRDGGWGLGRNGASSPEETSFALLGLLANKRAFHPEISEAAARGVEWLMENQNSDGSWEATPVGIYCEALWYYEKTYPLAYPLKALAMYRKTYA